MAQEPGQRWGETAPGRDGINWMERWDGLAFSEEKDIMSEFDAGHTRWSQLESESETEEHKVEEKEEVQVY